MTHSSTRTKLIAAITVLAVALACVFAAVFYTRTGEQNDAPVQSGESASETSSVFPLDYGDPVENTIPSSGAAAISNQEQFYAFINGTGSYGTASYGYLTDDITLSTWQQGNLVLEQGRTLDGNGWTVQIDNANTGLQSVYNGTGIHLSEDSSGGTDANWWGMSGGTSYSLSNGRLTYAFSDIVSANYGTIKNLTVKLNGNGKKGDTNDHIRISQYTGNAVMGVVAGYNAGVIQNVSVTISDRYGIVPSHYAHHDQDDEYVFNVVSEQYMVAVGGIAGYNEGKIIAAQVNLGADLGIFNANKQFVTQNWIGSWNQEHNNTENYRIDSGSVGGVAGINDGGNILGIDFYGGDCWLYNTVKHQQTSYIGAIVGLANIGGSTSFSRELRTGESWSIRRGRINYLTIRAHSNFSLNMRSAGYSARYSYYNSSGRLVTDINSYGTERDDLLTRNTVYSGLIGGMLSDNSTLAEYIVLRDSVNNGAKFSGGHTGADTAPSQEQYSNSSMFGYGSGSNDYTKDLTTTLTRFDGQALAGSNTDLSSAGATTSYIWSGYVDTDGSAKAGLLQNISFEGIGDLAGQSYSVYRFQGFINGSGAAEVSLGSDNIYGVDIGSRSILFELPVYTSSGNLSLEYRYSLTVHSLPTADSLDAFFGVNEGSGFGYAYANAVILNADNTVSDKPLAPSGSRVFPDWKTFDGQGHRLTVTSSNVVSGSGAQVTTGGQTFNAYGDFISVNNGVINNVVFRQIGGGERADITGVSGNVAYGNVVGVNNGTMNAVYHNNAGGESLRTVVTTSGAYLALGGVAGINLGTINNTASIVWADFQGSAQTGTFVGGVVGLNMGAGTLRNAKIDGVAPRVMRASGGEAYLGGILGLGANGTNGGRTVGGLSVTSTLSESPFSDWFFAGKQTLDQTSGAYVGMLAGGVTSDPTETDRPLLGMIVMMPDTQYDLGWFTNLTNKPSLLGRSNGTASAQGYIATSMVGGYSVVAQDASNLYITAAVSDYNGSVTNNAFAGSFVSTLNTMAESYDLPTATYYHLNDSVTAAITDAGTDQNGRLVHNISVPSTAAQLSAIDNSDNPENYAQTIALRYNYTVDLNQSQSDSDTSSSQHALYLFLMPKIYGKLADDVAARLDAQHAAYMEVLALRDRVDLIRRYEDHSRSALEMLRLLCQEKAENVIFQSFTYNRDTSVRVVGLADDTSDVYGLKDALQKDRGPNGETRIAAVNINRLTQDPKTRRQRFDIEILFPVPSEEEQP